MKTFYAILCIAIASLTQLQAQAPQGFNYQATVRNSSGDLIVNTNVYFKFNVMQGSQTSLPVFTEIHYVPTDDLGQVNLVIGEGTANTGTFSELDWSLGSYYLGIELSINGANNYVAMGTTQLLSVPYALYAENSGNSTPTTPNLEAVLAENNSANNQQIKDLQDPTEAQDAVTKAYVDGLSNNQGLMNFNGWDNYQISNDNSTFQLQPNSFLFLNANETTLILPQSGNYGDVVYIYVAKPATNGRKLYLQPNGTPYAYLDYDFNLITNDTETVYGTFGHGTLQILFKTSNYWMCSNFQELTLPNDIDNDGDGYTENQGDCDDTNASINPGATEIQDGIDNDCDGQIDEGFSNLPNNLGIVGSAVNNWGGSGPDTPLVYQGNGIYEAYVTFIDGELKFRDNNDWAYNWGDTGADGILDQNGDNIVVVAGVYLVTVNWFDMTYTLQQIDTTLTDGENNTYTTLPYGTQIWSTTNAEMITYRDGTPIPQVTDNAEWENLTTGAWAYYNNDPTKPRLYNWYAVMGIHDTDPNTPNKEFAPEGWHVPSDAEWTTLENYLIANGYNYDGTTRENKIAKAMSSTTGWSTSTELGAVGNDQSLNNSSGFNAFPEGYRSSSGSFSYEGNVAFFWSSTEDFTYNAWYRFLSYNYSYLFRNFINKQDGFSVRFVRD